VLFEDATAPRRPKLVCMEAPRLLTGRPSLPSIATNAALQPSTSVTTDHNPVLLRRVVSSASCSHIRAVGPSHGVDIQPAERENLLDNFFSIDCTAQYGFIPASPDTQRYYSFCPALGSYLVHWKTPVSLATSFLVQVRYQVTAAPFDVPCLSLVST